jgi:glycosyltransferase involved in cell wall biosynthesis
MSPFFSICIPCYEMKGSGLDFLKFNFKTFKQQTFQDFEVIISDHSKNDEIEKLCTDPDVTIDINIKYIRNKNNIGNSSANLNNCIKNANGKWIKVLFQDDFLYGKQALQDLKEFIDQNFENYSENYDENGIIINDYSMWVVTGSEHTTDGYYLLNPYEPRWCLEAIYKGHNTISSPSVLIFKNEKENNIYFDENLIWLMDIDYYYRLYLKYGEPKILKKTNVVNRVWLGSITANIEEEIKQKELDYFQKKFNIKT